MQKLVTIFLHCRAQEGDKGVREHLKEELAQGWKVVSMVPVGSTGGCADGAYIVTEAWLAVLLEKEKGH
jgi:hypothetical protein